MRAWHTGTEVISTRPWGRLIANQQVGCRLSAAYSFDHASLANIFIVGGAGTLLGGFLFGALGDRIGRRRAMIGATAAFGLLTLLLTVATLWLAIDVHFRRRRRGLGRRSTPVPAPGIVAFSSPTRRAGRAPGGNRPVGSSRPRRSTRHSLHSRRNRASAAAVLLPAAALPFLLAIGLAPLSAGAFLAVMGVLSIFLGGSHYEIISISGTFYPTPQRALGTGWMSGMGKLGSIMAPWLGGLMLGSGMPGRQTFAVFAICPALLALCAFTIGALERAGKVRPAA